MKARTDTYFSFWKMLDASCYYFLLWGLSQVTTPTDQISVFFSEQWRAHFLLPLVMKTRICCMPRLESTRTPGGKCWWERGREREKEREREREREREGEHFFVLFCFPGVITRSFFKITNQLPKLLWAFDRSTSQLILPFPRLADSPLLAKHLPVRSPTIWLRGGKGGVLIPWWSNAVIPLGVKL